MSMSSSSVSSVRSSVPSNSLPSQSTEAAFLNNSAAAAQAQAAVVAAQQQNRNTHANNTNNTSVNTSGHANGQSGNNVPVWRSVGEKSALRGYLTILGVTPEASIADIRGAYKKLALQWHPDRSDAPNARMKFQEISAAYMALCVSEENSDINEIDVTLYEKATQQQCENLGYLNGMCGVTSGLAGVFNAMGVGSNSLSPYLGIGGRHLNSTTASLATAAESELFRNGKFTKLNSHSIGCTCHSNHHTVPCNTNNTHNEATKLNAALVEPPPSHVPPSHLLDAAAAAAAADVSLLTGLLPPPIVASGDTSCQVHIQPVSTPMLESAGGAVVYQIQVKIKSKYQLVYQGSAPTYTVPNLLPGTKYMFRVRACPASLAMPHGSTSLLVGEQDEELMDEILPEVGADEATGLGLFSQPTTVCTQGSKPDASQPHPPVLSNLQLLASSLKGKKDGKKAKAKGKSKEDKGSTTPPQQLQLEDTHESSESQQSNVSTPKGKNDLTPSHSTSSVTPPSSASIHSQQQQSLSKKDLAKLKKKEEEDRRKEEAAAAAARKLEEEIAYEKFLLQKREEAERIRLQEEQEELDRYAKLKEEQDQRRKAQEDEEKVNAKKHAAKANSASPAKASTPLLPTPPTATVNPTAANANARSAKGKNKATESAASAPMMHIKLSAEQQAAIKHQQTVKETPIVATVDKRKPATPAAAAKPVSSEKPAVVATTPAAAPIIAATVTVSKAPAWTTAPPASILPPALPTAVTASPSAGATPASISPASKSPIILGKSSSGKAWQMDQVNQPNVAPINMPSFTSLSSTHSNLQADTLLSEHLNRFDSHKPWLQQPQQQQPQQSMMQQPQVTYGEQPAYLSREPALPAYPSYGTPLTSDFTSSLTAGHPSSYSSVPQHAWSTSEDDLLLSDLQHELERERWNAHPTNGAGSNGFPSAGASAAEVAWNNTANTTLPSHSILSPPLSNSSIPHFAPLSSLLSPLTDSYDNPVSSHDGIYMPNANSRQTSGFYSNSSQGSTTPPQSLQPPSQQPQAFTSYSSLNGFPSAGLGLSRDAPSFNPSTQSSESPASSLLAHHHSNSAGMGHTRLPLPSTQSTSLNSSMNGSTNSTSTNSSSNLFNGFGLPSFSPFSAFGSQTSTGSSALLNHSDWASSTTGSDLSSGLASSASLSLHDPDDSDVDLLNSIPALSTDNDETLIPGGIRSSSTFAPSAAPWSFRS